VGERGEDAGMTNRNDQIRFSEVMCGLCLFALAALVALAAACHLLGIELGGELTIGP
jgi:hypothetical protein